MKLLTVVVPCYNSEAYMDKCIKSLLVGGDRVEIIIVNDGSTKDNTAGKADEYQRRYPNIVRVIHQQNKGHGGAVNTGIENATGLYFKVCDSDDHLHRSSLLKVLETLENMTNDGQSVDMFISNYVYDKVDADRKMVMRYGKFFPRNTIFNWEDTKKLDATHYVLMHSIIYRTEVLRMSGLKLPEHTFYVDNLYAFVPIPFVKKLYYLDVDLYRYYIGREDQSVNEEVMVGRLDQQIKVNEMMIDFLSRNKNIRGKKYHYMMHYLSIIMSVTTAICLKADTEESLEKKFHVWNKLRNECPREYADIALYPTSIGLNLPGKVGRKLSLGAYSLMQYLFGFN